jgi:hypothetical protein
LNRREFINAAVADSKRATLLVFFCILVFLQGPSARAQPALSPAEQEQALAVIRQYALNYAKSLPDYTCTRVTQQKSSPVIMIYATDPELFGKQPPGMLPSTLAIDEELTVAGQRESYKVLKVDGIGLGPRMKLPPDQIVGTIAVSEFSSVLDRIFDPETGTSFRWARLDKLRGRLVIVFSFDVPRSHGERVYDRAVSREVMVGYQGLVYADAESKAVLRVDTHSSDFPSDSEFIGIDLRLDYKTAKIGSREFVLPYRFNLQWHRHIPSARVKAKLLPEEASVEAEYKNYRGFSAQSGITYGGADSPPQGEAHSTITFGAILSPEKK